MDLKGLDTQLVHLTRKDIGLKSVKAFGYPTSRPPAVDQHVIP